MPLLPQRFVYEPDTLESLQSGALDQYGALEQYARPLDYCSQLTELERYATQISMDIEQFSNDYQSLSFETLLT
jgi:hypothetical protein